MIQDFHGLRAAVRNTFQVVSVLGRGGTATVFRALDLRHDRWVALKVLDADVAGFLTTDSFFREIAITANLQHPHILPLLDSGEADRVGRVGLLFVICDSGRGTDRDSGTCSAGSECALAVDPPERCFGAQALLT